MSKILLRAQNLRKRFGGIAAVNDVSLDVAPLEIKCVIGANGAGKSSLFNILCGALRPDAGSLIFSGQSLQRRALHHFARVGIARKFQVPSVFESLSVERNLSVALIGANSERDIAWRVDEVLDIIDQRSLRHETAGVLAHGQKQWLEIGMALMSHPKLLLLDEPTAGMTREETQRTASLIHRLAHRTAIVAIEHDMSFVRALGCHTYVMHQGKIIAEGRFADIERNELVRDVYLGRA